MIRLLVPPGLRPEGEGIFVGRADSIIRASRSSPTVQQCADDDAIERGWVDGTCLIRSAADLAEVLSTPSRDVDLGLAGSRGLTATRDGVISTTCARPSR